VPWWRRPWAKRTGLVAGAVVGVYALIYVDVLARARESFLQGETYMEWHRHPEKKKAHFDQMFAREKAALDKALARKKVTPEDYEEKLDALKFDTEFALQESSLKYAYQWYKDTYELFSPPESRWVRQARAKAPETLELWKAELRGQNVAFEDYMFE
jgi:hypothetical protein